MLFLPECLGFIGDNAEHTLQNADPSMEVQMKKNSNCVLPMNSFREALGIRSTHALRVVVTNNMMMTATTTNITVKEDLSSL